MDAVVSFTRCSIIYNWNLEWSTTIYSDYCSHQAMIDVNTVERLILDTGWWFGTWMDYFSVQLGISSSQLTKSIIFRGRAKNHQPLDQSGRKDQDFYVGTVGIFRWIFQCLILHTSSRWAVTFFLDETKWSQGQMRPIMKIWRPIHISS